MKQMLHGLFIAIFLFVAGLSYGNAPIDVNITCDIPSGVYEYEVGDTFEVHVTYENLGRPYATYMYKNNSDELEIRADVLQSGDMSEDVCAYPVDWDGSTDSLLKYSFAPDDYEAKPDAKLLELRSPEAYKNMQLIKKGFKAEQTFTFTVSEHAPKGQYYVHIDCLGKSCNSPLLITVK